MTRNRKLIVAGVGAIVLGAAAVGAVAAHRGGDWGHHGGGWRHGHSMGQMGVGLGRLCWGNPAEMADHFLIRVQYKVKPTEAQQGAFDELKAAAKAAADKVAAACPEKRTAADRGTPRPRLTPIERLGLTQTQLEASLDAVKTVRPAAEKFYASLSDEQKAELSPQRKRFGKRHDRHRGDGDRSGTDGSTDSAPPAPQE